MKKEFGLKILIMLIFICCIGVLCGFAEKSEQRVIRVGYMPNEGYISQIDKDSYEGYMCEYMEMLGYYGDWQCEYVEGTLEECLEWLAEGKIDIFPGIVAESVREGIVLSELPLTQNKDSIYTLKSYARPGDMESLQNCRIGYVEGTNLYPEFFEEQGINCEFKPYDNMVEVLEALKERKVNAALGTVCTSSVDMSLIANVSPNTIYVGFHAGDENLKKQVEEALKMVSMEMPELLTELKSKYDADANQKHGVILSQVEKEYIEKDTMLRIAYVRDDLPSEYRTEAGGAAGINVEIVNKVLENVGMTPYWIPVRSTQEGLDYLKNGLVEAVAGVFEGNGSTETDDFLITESYRNNLYSVMGVKGTKAEELQKEATFVFQKGDANGMVYAKTNYPDCKIIKVDTEEEIFDVMKSGKGDATLVLSTNSEYYTLKYGSEFVNLTETYSEVPIGIALGKGGSNQLLLSILDHGIRHLTMDEINNIVLENRTLQKEYTLWMNIKKNRTPLIVGLVAVVALMVFYTFIHKKYQNSQIWKAVYEDSVTGRDNYEKMLMDIEKIFVENKQTEYSVCYMDIVKFKYINENYGYVEGDRLLRSISDGLAEIRQDGDYFARVSADRFVFLVRDKDQDHVIKRMNDLQNRVSEENRRQNVTYPFRLLIGIYLINELEDKMSVLDKANIARKSIKDSDIYVAVYDNKMHEVILKEREIEAIMRKSLENQEFQVYLQPRVDIYTGETVGAEALVRWQRTNSDFLYPDVFIPLFEKNGFIKDLDFYVYEKVCKMLRSRMDSGKEVVPVSLNVSRLHLVGDDFLRKFNKLVHKYQIPEDLLELELTESLLVEDPAVMIDTVNQLKANSYSVSIDDFGSGYSSLNILKQLQFDVLKIDKEFLGEGDFEYNEVIILRSVIQMAKELEMKVLIEGVETHEQVRLLQELECDYAQGYYFARPMPMHNFEEKLDSGNKIYP